MEGGHFCLCFFVHSNKTDLRKVIILVGLVKLILTLSCHRRGTGGDRDPRRWEKRETIPNATLSPPE